MKSSEWVAVLIAGLGILGTLCAAAIAQVGEARRAQRATSAEAMRRHQDREDALAREAREALRGDYREVLRFLTRTRLFVMTLRRHLTGLEEWAASASDDSREVEDLEARSKILRLRLLEELPDVQSLVGVWAPASLLETFDEIYEFAPKISAVVTVAVHLKVSGRRSPEAMAEAVKAVDQLLDLLNQARINSGGCARTDRVYVTPAAARPTAMRQVSAFA